MIVDVVVARYSEPLDWLATIPDEWRIFVYDKGGTPALQNGPLKRAITTIPRPNIGRDLETFLWHNLTTTHADYTIYLQGRPFDHCADPIPRAQTVIEKKEKLGWLGPTWDATWNALPHRLCDLGTAEVWPQIFPNEPVPENFLFPAGAQMVVHRDRLVARTKEWWYNAHRVSFTNDWRMPHCIERFCPAIYGSTL